MKVEIGRRYKVKGFSVIVTVVAIYDDVHIEVAYDNSVTGVMAAGNCVTPSIYDEIRDFDCQEMDEFLQRVRSHIDIDEAFYWTKASRWFNDVDSSVRADIMHRHCDANNQTWVWDALQELWMTNKAKEDAAHDD